MKTWALIKETLSLRAFGAWKIPLIFFVSPSVEQLEDDLCRIRIPLKRATKNHLGCMYFGALCVGADVAGGILAYRLIQRDHGGKINLIFQDFKAEFLKRAETGVDFYCADGPAIRELVQKAAQSGERVSLPVKILALPAGAAPEAEPYARFELTLSLKARTKKAHS